MELTAQKLNIASLPNQTVKVNLKVGEETKVFNLIFNYREVCKYWTMTVKDSYLNDLISNIPIVTGGGLLEAGNLLMQYGYKDIGSAIIYKAKENELDYPDEFSLGTDFELYWCNVPTRYLKDDEVEV